MSPETIYYVMIQSGLMEFEGKIYYEVRTDRPWTEEELFGFKQVILIEKPKEK